MKPNSQNALTLVEIIVMLAVIGILAAIFIPTVGRVSDCGGRTVDGSNIRQIAQASLIYANDNREKLPGLNLNQVGKIDEESSTPNIHALAAALARMGGLNDASLWTSRFDGHPDLNQRDLVRILEDDEPRTLSPAFVNAVVSFQYVAGLNTTLAPTTPIAFTRGLQSDGRWAKDRRTSVYGKDGGYVVFMSGNVRFHEDLRDEDDQLKTPTDEFTSNILKTIDSSQRIFSYPATPTGAVDGMPGIGGR